MCSQETIEKLNMRADHSSARAKACQPSKMLRAQAGPWILSAVFFLRVWLILCESEEVCKWKLFIQNKFSDSVVSLQTMSYTSWSDHHSVSLLCPLPACICSATWIKEPISMKTTFSQCLNRLCDPALLMTWSSTCEKSAAATDSLTSWSLELRDTLELPEWRCGLSVFSFLTRMIERA